MKITLSRSTISMAVATLVTSGAVWAQDVNIVGHMSLSDNLSIDSYIPLHSKSTLASAALALVNDGQSASNIDEAKNKWLTNSASTGDSAMAGVHGNVGLNMAGGDNNLQDNATAISVTAPTDNGALVAAAVFVDQNSHSNTTRNSYVTNNSSIGSYAFNGAAGNIGANVASGNNNLQKNDTAIAVGNGVLQSSSKAEKSLTRVQGDIVAAAVFVDQKASGNVTLNYKVANSSVMDSYAFSYATGNIGANVASGSNNEQKNSTAIAVGDGVLAVAGVNTNQEVCGNATSYDIDQLDTNTVALGNYAFMGAGGNIGVNMAAGSNNLQSNSMAISVTYPSQQ